MVVRRLHLRSSLKEAVKPAIAVLQKDFLKYTVRSEASDFAVSMLMVSNHTLLAGWIGLTTIQNV
jgi:hypothetical protein